VVGVRKDSHTSKDTCKDRRKDMHKETHKRRGGHLSPMRGVSSIARSNIFFVDDKSYSSFLSLKTLRLSAPAPLFLGFRV
jgi:hypothetical protein